MEAPRRARVRLRRSLSWRWRTITGVRVDKVQGATFVELFFDLVFVYAVTQLTSAVLHDLTWAGVGRAALLFWLVWWSWTQFTWTLNAADTEHIWIRLPTLAATAVAFFLAQAVPDAFTTAGLWFAASYALVRLIGLGVQGWLLGADRTERASFLSFALPSLVGIMLVLAGALVGRELRPWLWAGAVLADILTAEFAGRGVWAIEPGHFAERHGLIVIIALGESLIAAGVATTDLERDMVFALTTAGAVTATCALWWLYFGTLHSRFEVRLASQNDYDKGRYARDVFSLWHASVVAGVIGMAVGIEEAVAHPDEALSSEASLALTLGVALFAGGLGGAAWRAGLAPAAVTRGALAALVLAATPLVSMVPAFAALWALSALTVAVAVLEPAVWQRRPVRPA